MVSKTPSDFTQFIPCAVATESDYQLQTIYDNCIERGFTTLIYQNEFGKTVAYLLPSGVPEFGYPVGPDIMFYDLDSFAETDYDTVEPYGAIVFNEPDVLRVGDLYLEDKCNVNANYNQYFDFDFSYINTTRDQVVGSSYPNFKCNNWIVYYLQ